MSILNWNHTWGVSDDVSPVHKNTNTHKYKYWETDTCCGSHHVPLPESQILSGAGWLRTLIKAASWGLSYFWFRHNSIITAGLGWSLLCQVEFRRHQVGSTRASTSTWLKYLTPAGGFSYVWNIHWQWRTQGHTSKTQKSSKWPLGSWPLPRLGQPASTNQPSKAVVG